MIEKTRKENVAKVISKVIGTNSEDGLPDYDFSYIPCPNVYAIETCGYEFDSGIQCEDEFFNKQTNKRIFGHYKIMEKEKNSEQN